MTVGELVIDAAGGWFVGCQDMVSHLKPLGIWDAEVLEGQIIKGYDEDGEDRFGIAPLDGKLPYVWVGTHDEVVRVIVLKEAEDDTP
jgi:hypothetical protein